jgi:hypothetical protein
MAHAVRCILPPPRGGRSGENPTLRLPWTSVLKTGEKRALHFHFASSQSFALGLIQAPLFAVNFADDELNPVGLGGLQRAIAQVKHIRTRLRSKLPPNTEGWVQPENQGTMADVRNQCLGLILKPPLITKEKADDHQ